MSLPPVIVLLEYSHLHRPLRRQHRPAAIIVGPVAAGERVFMSNSAYQLLSLSCGCCVLVARYQVLVLLAQERHETFIHGALWVNLALTLMR